MERKTFPTRNSAVISIRPEAFGSIGLALGDEVIVAVDAELERIVLTSATLRGVQPAWLDRVDWFTDRYQPPPEALAED
ncbi:MAG: hypothetical protein PVJ55_07400 [Anaerolineae bacterium]|jgi:hypothetical protein